MRAVTTIDTNEGYRATFAADGRTEVRMHRLTKDQFDALTDAFVCVREPETINSGEGYYFWYAEVNMQGITTGLYSEHQRREVDPEQLTFENIS